MRKLLGLALVAGLLLVVGVGAVLAQTTPAASPSASGTTVPPVKAETDTLLSTVLDGLVSDGTITRAQADKILSTLQTRREADRTAAQKLRDQLRQFLADGQITADELAQLPPDNPLRNLDKFLADGKLSADELRQLGGLGFGLVRGHGFGFGKPFGRGGPFYQDDNGQNGAAPSTSPSASPNG